MAGAKTGAKSKVKSEGLSFSRALGQKLSDYAQLVKMRLSLTVVFSALIGYLLAAGGAINILHLIPLFVGGFLVTAAANALNQVLEVEYDALMNRTKNRPIPAGRMKSVEAIFAAGIMASSGLSILGIFFNPTAALLGAVSMLSYTFIYTPLKRLSPIAVFVGALPGALPPMIGWAAFGGAWNQECLLLFTLQFLWQFPHFWAIAWMSHDDYAKAGFRLLPSQEGRSHSDALQTLMFTLVLVGISTLVYFQGFVGPVGSVVIVLTGLYFLMSTYRLLKEKTNSAAKKVLLASVMYLTIVQLTWLLDQI